MVHWLPCWDTYVCQKLAHLDVGINAHGHLYPKMPWRTWTFYLFLPNWYFWGWIYEIFEISQVSYFLCKLGTKVNQCALVSSVSDYFWIFGAPRKFWPKRRRRQVMPGGWILAHLDVGINARGHLYPKIPCRAWTFYLFLPDWHFLMGNLWNIWYFSSFIFFV